MKILVVGAGAIGGYFGGRLLNAGRDVTFLVRPRRAAELAKTGLAVRSRLGDVDIPAPPTVLTEALRGGFDLIILSCKAYDLRAAADSFAPAVGPDTAILPLLNGIGHLDTLTARFGESRVLGGLCMISTTLDADGRILHLNDLHALAFGERDGALSARAQAIAQTMAGAGFEMRLTTAILQEMWEKWVFIAAGAGITCLMRATVGDIVAAGATDLTLALIEECAAIAGAQGFPPGEAAMARSRTMFTAPGSAMAASMLRDVERGGPTEADHVLGDLLRRGEEKGVRAPLLAVAYAHLKSYEARRAREIVAKQAA